jgi:predicted transcriptional regulator
MNLAEQNRKQREPYEKEKIYYVEQSTYINNETGEIKKQEEKKVIRIPKEDEYIKIYIKTIGVLHNIPASADKILLEIIRYVNYDNRIIITKPVKEKIAERLGLSYSRVHNYISTLSKKNILIREDRGMYILNPYIFGKGNWHDIYNLRKELRLDVVFKEGEIEILEAGNNNT